MTDSFGVSDPHPPVPAELLDWLVAHLDEGVSCPLCEQFAKVYRRKITAPMALGLIRWRQRTGFTENHVDLVRNETHEFSQLAWWPGFIHEVPGRREDGGKAGRWVLGQEGHDFSLGLTKVPKYARIYDGHVLGHVDDEMVDIRDALGTKFNYDDLMRGE